jgi:hypothetical protein
MEFLEFGGIFLGQIVRLAKVLVDVGRRPVVGQGGLHADRVSPRILYDDCQDHLDCLVQAR